MLTDRKISEFLNRPMVGLNADWCVSAWQLTEGPANLVDGAWFILDLEDGTLGLLRRFFDDEVLAENELVRVEPHTEMGLYVLRALFDARCPVCDSIFAGHTCC